MERILKMKDPPAGKPVGRVFFAIILILGLLVSSCDRALPVHGEPDTETGDTPVLKIEEIPFFKIVPREPPMPLPYPEAGLRFQRSTRSGDPRFQRFKPIGEACFGPKGDIYITFPERDAVARFRKPDYELTIFGSSALGGNNEIIKDPERIRFIEGQMILSNRGNGQVLIYDTDANFNNVHELDRSNPIPGPGSNFILTFPQNPSAFLRVDENGNICQRYLMTDSPGERSEEKQLVFDVQDDWEIVCIRKNGHRLYHVAKNAKFLRQIELDFSSLFSRTEVWINDLEFFEDRYWILGAKKTGEELTSFVLVLGQKGDLLHFWDTAYYADGFDITATDFLLYNKSEGSVQTYRR